MMRVQGEPVKRYRMSNWGQFLGSYDTAKEAVEEWKRHNRVIRPVIDRKNQGRYSIWDGRKEITLGELRKGAEKE